MEKKDIRVSDAIPQRPASFDDAVERTLARVVKKEQKEQQKETPARIWKTENVSKRKRGSGRSVLDIVAIALIFVICVGAIGAVIGARLRLFRTAPADQIAELPTAPVNMSNTVYVSTVDELLAALAPDTRIVLADGTYDLTTASDYGTEGGEYYTWEDRSDNWFREPEENSFELCLQNLQKCCITGSRNAEIVTVPRTAAVLYARNCSGLVLSGFTAGHTVMADPCEGEVIRLVECPNAWVENCSLYGCGTWGVSAVDCDNLTVTGSDIHECSSGGVAFVRCHDTLLSGCALRNCGYRDNAFSIVYIYDCKSLRITGCDVYENRTDVLFNLYGDDVKNSMDDVLILGTSVHDNEVLDQGFYSYTAKGPVVAGCEFKNNSGVLLSDEQRVFDRDGNPLNEADLLAMALDRTLDAELEAFPTLEPETPNTLVPAIRYNMLLYTLSDVEFAGEIDESAITGRVSSVVPLSEWPRMHGETNFGKIGMPYAETENGLVVLFENEWRLMEPVMPDPAAGVIDAACAQVLAERKEIDERYRHTGTMTEEEIGELDAEANFNHQRLVKLMNLWAKAVSVEQEDGQMRLSQIAFDEDKLYFAFAASPDCAFDSAPVIGVNGHIYATGDESGFIGLKATETEHYAFYSVYPGTLSGTVLITVANNNNNFCFKYHADDGTAALPQDIETAQQWLKKLDYVTPAPHCDVDPAADALCLFVDGDKTYKPFENWIWSDQDDGIAADGMTFLWKMEEVRDKIPTIYNPGKLTVTAGDGVNLEPKVNIYDAALNTVAFGADISTVCTLDPGTYYISQRVSRREEGKTSGYECIVRIEIGETAEQPTPESAEEPPMQESSAIPSTFRVWEYDEENGYREAPEEGVLFVCDFDGDGTEEEIAYQRHGQYVAISVGDESIDVDVVAGLEQVILLDLDPASARLNLLVVYNTGSDDYETAELHMENGRFVRGPVIFAYCSCEADSVRGSSTQTDILGTKTGERTYHGENLTPDSEWYDCEVIPTADEILSDRAHLIEWGKLLHVVRDLPCTIDGADAVIPAGSYIYMTRWHESGALAEIRTEDGTTALVAVREADPNDPDLAGCLIDGVMQYEYFDNIFFAD